jgi:DME family drug/metabolite transporter
MAAFAAAVAFATYNVGGSHMVQRHDRWKVLLYALLGAVSGWLLVNPPWKVVAAHYTGEQWGFLAIFAATSALIPFSLYFSGLEHLDATRAVVTSCLEPVFSIVLAASFLGESVGPLQVVGMAVVIVATIIAQMPERKSRARNAS